MFNGCHLIWLHAMPETTFQRTHGDVRLDGKTVITNQVKTDLATVYTGIDDGTTATEWGKVLKERYSHTTVGLAVVRPQPQYANCFTILSQSQRSVYDFWHQAVPSEASDGSILFFDILDAKAFARPQHVYRKQLASRSCQFFNMTVASRDRLLGAQAADGRAMSEWVSTWAQNFAIHDSESALTVQMPAPHAVLCAFGRWKSWGFLLGKNHQSIRRQQQGLFLQLLDRHAVLSIPKAASFK